MADSIPFQQSEVKATYGIRLWARYQNVKGVRTLKEFYADTSDEEEMGDLGFPTEEALLVWLRKLICIEQAPALEIINGLKDGEVCVLHNLFTKEQLISAGVSFRSVI